MASVMIPRPRPGDYAPSFDAEIQLVPEVPDFAAMLAAQVEETAALITEFDRFGDEGAELRYAPGKWSVREVVGHLSDCERVLSYRALRLARGDTTPLPGFDHDAYVPAGAFGRRTLADVFAEFRAVRGATCALVAGLPPGTLDRAAQVGTRAITVAALLYVIAGHERHHQRRLRADYRPGLTALAER